MHKNNRLLIAVIIYATAMGLLLLLQALVSLGCFDHWSDQVLELVFTLVSQVLIMFGVPLVMLLASQKISKEPMVWSRVTNNVGWHKLSGKNVLMLIFLGICLHLLNIFVASIFGSMLQSFGYQYANNPNVFEGYQGLIISLLISAVLPGFCEEFLHRGILLNGMVKKCGVRRALIFSSLLFGLMHMNVGQFFYTTILGWFFGITVLATGSLWSSMILHFINNALAVYSSYASELNLPAGNFLSALFGNSVLLILVLIIVIVAIGDILRRLAQENFNKNADVYTVRYLAAQNQFNTQDFEKIKTALPEVIKRMPTWKAIMAYVETFDEPKKARPGERAILCAVFALGIALTVLSFVWGTW